MSCPENFTGIITGASSGIGEYFARELAKNSYNLLLIARREEKLEQLAIELEYLYELIRSRLEKLLQDPRMN